MSAMIWQIDNHLPEVLRMAWIALRGIRVSPASVDLGEEIANKADELRGLYADPVSALPAFAPARRLYHDLGLDPSKHRPASEALVRRILQGRDFPRVNTAVDAANLASIACLRPVGLYDSARIDGLPEPVPGSGGLRMRVALRRGSPGEEYRGIGKEVVHLHGRPALFDRQGPFGNPSSDSDRTKVTLETRSLLFVLFEPATEDEREIGKRLVLSRSILIKHLGGEVEE